MEDSRVLLDVSHMKTLAIEGRLEGQWVYEERNVKGRVSVCVRDGECEERTRDRREARRKSENKILFL